MNYEKLVRKKYVSIMFEVEQKKWGDILYKVQYSTVAIPMHCSIVFT